MKRFIYITSILLLFSRIGLGQTVCPPAELISPANNSTFYLSQKERPDFNWISELSNPSYTFELYRSGKLLFSQIISEKILSHNDNLENIYKAGFSDPTPYQWLITSRSETCAETISKKGYFYVLSSKPALVASGGAEIEVENIVCLDPAFDTLGNVHYAAEINLKNLPASFANWDVSNLTLNGNTYPVTALKSCVSPFSPQTSNPISIPPGSTETWCLDFSLPFGTTPLLSLANGVMGSLPLVVPDQDSLPNCVCNYCDQLDTLAVLTNDSLMPVTGYNYDFLIIQDIQLPGYAPIKEMKAEIIGLQHTTNNDLCQICVKNANQMGLFMYNDPSNPVVKPRDLGGPDWQNNNEGQAGVDFNSDNHTNQLIWKATNPLAGVDFSSAPRKLRLTIGMPGAGLECCESDHKFCIRYTLEDINCKVCDLEKCYQIITH